MGKKKISEFTTVTPSSTDKFLVEQADGTYKSVLASSITTGTTPDGLNSGGTITVGTYGGSGTNNDIRVTPASWYISPDNYSTVINTDFLDIALSSSGLQRYIGIYGTTSNTITKVEGSEAALATYPTTPANSIVIGYVLVNDASASTTPDLSGYMLKADKATQASNVTGTNDTTYITPLANAVKENTANKSSSYTASSTTTYANTKALVDGLATKQDTLVSGTNIKTVGGNSLLGSGDIAISSGYTQFFVFVAFSPADATTYYIGNAPNSTPTTAVNTTLARSVMITKDGIIKTFAFTTAAFSTLGSTENGTLTIELYDINKSFVSSNSLTSVFKFDSICNQYLITGLNISVLEGYNVILKWVTPTWATNPTQAWIQGNLYIQT